MSIKEALQALGDRAGASATVKNVYGDPITSGDRTVIPAACVRYGFGAGGGQKEGEREGGGGGMGVLAQPSGALEITPGGTRYIDFSLNRTIVAAVACGFVIGFLAARLTRE